MFKPLPLNPPLPLLRWSNDQPQSRNLHGCHGHETTTGHGCRNILQKKKLIHRFVMIKQCYMSTHALATQKETEKMPIISYAWTHPWCRWPLKTVKNPIKTSKYCPSPTWTPVERLDALGVQKLLVSRSLLTYQHSSSSKRFTHGER